MNLETLPVYQQSALQNTSENLIVQDDMEELQTDRQMALSDAAAARKKLRDHQQQAALTLQSSDSTIAAVG